MTAQAEHGDVLALIAAEIAGSRIDGRALIAIDGIDASGKTTFAGMLADAIRTQGREAVIVHTDDFLHIRPIRHRLGRESPEGYFADSYDYEALERHVLRPLSHTGDGWYRAGIADRTQDELIDLPVQHAGNDSVVIVEGLFLHRDELIDWWDHSIFLHVDVDTSLRRKERRDDLVLDAASPLTRRYVEGQCIYLDRCKPSSRATWVIENSDATTRLAKR